MSNIIVDLESYLISLNKAWFLRWKYIVLHHSLTSDGQTVNWDAIRRYHVEEMGWDDVGYHFGVEVVGGKVMYLAGRSLEKWGAHAKGFNKDGIGICVVGNYDLAPPEAEKWSATVNLCKMLKKHVSGRLEIIGHRETYPRLRAPIEKTCPGSKFDLNLMRKVVG